MTVLKSEFYEATKSQNIQFSNFHFCQYFRAGENGRELQKGDKYDWKQETVWPMGSDLTKYKLNFVEQQKKK